MNYRYASVLEAQNDGKPPNDNIEAGDKIVRAGKHETDSIEYMGEDGDLLAIEFEAVSIYESDSQMGERQAQEFARDRFFEEQEAEA